MSPRRPRRAADNRSLPAVAVAATRSLRLLGGGGMAEVLPVTSRLGSACYQVPRPELLANPSFAARFLVEARAMAQLQLGGTGEIYDFDQLPDGTPHIVMEYVAGECLRPLAALRQPTPCPAPARSSASSPRP